MMQTVFQIKLFAGGQHDVETSVNKFLATIPAESVSMIEHDVYYSGPASEGVKLTIANPLYLVRIKYSTAVSVPPPISS